MLCVLLDPRTLLSLFPPYGFVSFCALLSDYIFGIAYSNLGSEVEGVPVYGTFMMVLDCGPLG